MLFRSILTKGFCSPVGREGPGTDMRVAPDQSHAHCITSHTPHSSDVSNILWGEQAMENSVAGYGSIHGKPASSKTYTSDIQIGSNGYPM